MIVDTTHRTLSGSLVCLILGHRWEIVLVNWPKHTGLLHLHPLAGCWAICHRCTEEWNDLWYYCRELPRSAQERMVSVCPPQYSRWP